MPDAITPRPATADDLDLFERELSGTQPPREHNGVDTPTEQRTRPVAPEGSDTVTGKPLWGRLPSEARAEADSLISIPGLRNGISIPGPPGMSSRPGCGSKAFRVR
ncbi:hypothetical protein GPN2_20030 [Streptomyces murinus]